MMSLWFQYEGGINCWRYLDWLIRLHIKQEILRRFETVVSPQFRGNPFLHQNFRGNKTLTHLGNAHGNISLSLGRGQTFWNVHIHSLIHSCEFSTNICWVLSTCYAQVKTLAVGRVLWRRYILGEKSESQIDNACFIFVACICCQKKKNLSESTSGRLLRRELNEDRRWNWGVLFYFPKKNLQRQQSKPF